MTIGANLQNLNLIAVAAISGIVGMFSEQAEHKLNELADTTFGTTPSDKTTATTDEKNLNKIKAAKNRGWQFRHIENKQINQFDSLDGVITEKTRGQRVPQNISR